MIFPFKIVDLSHPISQKTKTWNNSCGFEITDGIKVEDKITDLDFCVQNLFMQAGISTHIDAPAHCIRDTKTIGQLDLNDLIGHCATIDISKKADQFYSLTKEDVEEFEKEHGQISKNSIVLVNTGWSKYFNDNDQYKNNFMFPSVSKEAAQLLSIRNIKAIAIDTFSPDRPSDGFQTHTIFLNQNKYIIENVANAHLMPATGAFIIALPLNLEGATECPIRLIGLIPNK